jgi:hypothetical protein
MRTTLDIDDDVLAAAKELAKSRNATAGQVISELARKALTTPASAAADAASPAGAILQNGWYVLPSRGGPPITNELVQRLLDEADWDDAGLSRDRK